MSAKEVPRCSPARRSVLFLDCAPFLISLVVYVNALPGDFVFDDIALIERDSGIRDLDFERVFRENYWGSQRADPNYRPLTLLSYSLNHQVSHQAWSFRLVNILLNALVVLLFHRICLKIFARRAAAFFAASLFALFPIHTEAVVNIVGRAELLAALAVFAAWWVIEAAPAREGWWRPVAAASVVFLGMFAKENTVVALVIVPLSVYCIRREVAWRSTLLMALAVLGYFILRQMAISDILEHFGGGVGRARLLDNPLAKEEPLLRVVNAIGLIGLYVVKTVFPVRLAADYSFDQIPVLPISSVVLWVRALAVVGGLAALLCIFGRRRLLLSVGTLFFCVALAPVANVLLPIGTIFGERLAYTPSAGIAIVLAALVEGWLEASRRRGSQALIYFVLGSVLVVYAARTVVRNNDWRDRVTMNLRMAEDSPRSARSQFHAAQGHLLLGLKSETATERKAHFQKVERAIRIAQEIYPEYARVQALRGELLIHEGRYREAVEALETAGELFEKQRLREPKVDRLKGEATMKLGLEAASHNLETEARSYLTAARRSLDAYLDALEEQSSPVDVEALSDRAIVRAELGDVVGAQSDLDAAIAAQPDLPALYSNRGFLRFRSGDFSGALKDYRHGLELCEREGWIFDPQDHNAFRFRLRIFDVQLQSKDLAEASKTLDALRKMRPRGSDRAVLESMEAKLQRSSPQTEN